MPLSIGERLGPYEIVRLIGAGGMGEVYRARDTKLDRDVAVKVLPAALANNPERMARFEREAKVLAALNHPNIAAIYGLEDRAIVMELVEGPTLAERIQTGSLELKEALGIALAIADALEAAHDKGIVHRDLKPANVKAPPEGVVKVLDFGLATAIQATARDSSEMMNSPTLTMGATEAGVILGTAAYMSPEQAVGKQVDRRADIWSFGVVLWEMLTGKRLFDGGETVSHTLADVLRAEIDPDKLPTETPRAVRDLLGRCLDRNVKNRLRDIGEARVAIGKYLADPKSGTESPVQPERSSHTRWPWIAAVAAPIIVLLALAFIHFRESPSPQHVLRYTIAAPENSGIHSFAISPNGQLLVMTVAINGRRQLWLRRMDTLQTQPMPTTEDALYPFWSPDGRWIGFFTDDKLRKIPASGGPSVPVCDALNGRGGSWNRDDLILFSTGGNAEGAIQRVSAAGGAPAAAAKAKGTLRVPVFLPDGRHFLYREMRGDQAGVYFASLDRGDARRVLADDSSVTYAPPASGKWGHILFIRQNTLMAQEFDPGAGQLFGDAVPVAEGVTHFNANTWLPATASDNGVLIYGTPAGGGSRQIVSYNHSGKATPIGAPANLVTPSFSPGEKTIAFGRGGNVDISLDLWLRDLALGNDTRFTTAGPQHFGPSWSPNGDRIVFTAGAGNLYNIYQKAANGSSQEELLISDGGDKFTRFSNQWSHDGQFVVYTQRGDPKTKGSGDIYVFSVSEKKPIPIIHSDANEIQGQLSSDSRWMAFTSDVSGRNEIYVQPFPAADNLHKISISGGQQPRWKRDGKELYFIGADGKMMAAPIKIGTGSKPSFESGAPLPLFDSHITGVGNNVFHYDVTGDGQRFIVVTESTVSSSPHLNVWLNWSAGLKE